MMNRNDERRSVTREGETTRRGIVEPRETSTMERPVSREEMREIYRREPMAVREHTWRPDTAGVLEILSGALNILVGIGAIVGVAVFSTLFTFTLPEVGLTIGAILIALGVISVVGGYFSIKRRQWWLALAGAIAALFLSPAILMGILATIFVTLGKPEFKS